MLGGRGGGAHLVALRLIGGNAHKVLKAGVVGGRCRGFPSGGVPAERSRFQAFRADRSNGCCSCEFFSIRDDKRAEVFVPCGCIMGRMPTSTILISLATWLGIYNTHQIPDSMRTKALASLNAFEQCLYLTA